MNEFWLWFIRLFAEFLGVIVFLACLITAFFSASLAYLYWLEAKAWWIRRRSSTRKTNEK